jgi:hypothetical protein
MGSADFEARPVVRPAAQERIAPTGALTVPAEGRDRPLTNELRGKTK